MLILKLNTEIQKLYQYPKQWEREISVLALLREHFGVEHFCCGSP